MINPTHSFQNALDAVGRLSLDEQQTLLHIVQRRLAELERSRIAADVAEARQEFQQGRCQPMSVESIMEEGERES